MHGFYPGRKTLADFVIEQSDLPIISITERPCKGPLVCIRDSYSLWNPPGPRGIHKISVLLR